MATQIRSSIVVLLAARRERQVDLYGKRKFPWTLMRHFLALALLSRRVAEAAIAAGLVAPARLPQRLRARRLATAARTVAVAAIASRADEEDLPAFGPAADDEAKRIHVPGADARKLDATHAAVRRTISSNTSL
jgi:hypothetical protein